jgi:predicted Holliday junction resolvase-like endonuclease
VHRQLNPGPSLVHPGNTLAAQAGVSLADLKARMGHDSVRAAMIYQHAAAEADQKIASTLDQRIEEARDDAHNQSRHTGLLAMITV